MIRGNPSPGASECSAALMRRRLPPGSRTPARGVRVTGAVLTLALAWPRFGPDVALIWHGSGTEQLGGSFESEIPAGSGKHLALKEHEKSAHTAPAPHLAPFGPESNRRTTRKKPSSKSN